MPRKAHNGNKVSGIDDSGGVAIVGCGWAGRRHAEAFIAEGARLAWAVDTDVERAADVATLQPGTRAAASIDEALSDPHVTMVDVCLPHHLHAGACLAAAADGKDVLCEKPLATTLVEADEMTEAADEAGILLMVAESECFSPLYRQVRTMLESGVIGQPALVQATRECYLASPF